MKLSDFYLDSHAAVHSRAVAVPESGVTIEDLVFRGLSDDLARCRPGPELNSIVWLTWHMARCEDVAINAVIAGEEQVLESGEWLRRLAVERTDIGTGMPGDEVGDFSQRVDIAAVRAYRAAVGTQTRKVVEALDPAELSQPASSGHLDRALAEGALSGEGQWVEQFWRGKSVSFFLWLGTGHNFLHLGEASVIRTLAGAPRGT